MDSRRGADSQRHPAVQELLLTVPELSPVPTDRRYFCPDGHSSTSADAFSRNGYTRVSAPPELVPSSGLPKAVIDAREATTCWMPGWKSAEFAPSHSGHDTVTVTSKRGVSEIWLTREAVTNLRSNIEDRNLWDKALLSRAMGPRAWLPHTVVHQGPPVASFCADLAAGLMERRPGAVLDMERVKWIIKPADGNKASGIIVFENASKLENYLVDLYRFGDDGQVYVIQEYLENPWLVDNVTTLT